MIQRGIHGMSIRPSKMNVWIGTYFVPKDKNSNAWMLKNYKSTLSSIFLFQYQSDRQGNDH